VTHLEASERRERAAQEAAEWLLRLTEGEMGRSERLEYVAWLRESPLHVAEMLRVAGVHRRLTEFDGWGEVPTAQPGELHAQVHTLHARRLVQHRGWKKLGVRRAVWAPLAALAAALATVGFALLHFGLPGHRNVAAGAGEWRAVTLPDGTQVQLAPRSHLQVSFTNHERDVVLADGNGLFHVAKDLTKPFVVISGRTRVRAVGTVFGIEHDQGTLVVTVEEGRVAVAEATRAAAVSPVGSRVTPTLEPMAVTEISLGANQQVVVPAAGALGTVRQVDSQRELAWAQGRLIFDNEPVADVVRRFNRFNRVQIEITDQSLAARPVTAVFDASDPEGFITFLESVADVRVTRTSADAIQISSEGPH